MSTENKTFKIEEQKLYAFWKYDLCPYMLGGEVEAMRPNGRVIIKGYRGMSFKPIGILPDETGADALGYLNRLREKYNKEEKELKDRYRKYAQRIFESGEINPEE